MKLVTKLFAFAGLVAAVILGDRRSQRRAKQLGKAPSSRAGIEDAELISGLSDVDPQPLTTFGEAVDPDATSEAHVEPASHRDRLPVRGKNIP